MDRTVYQAGSGEPGRGMQEGRWELQPGGERQFPLYTYTRCPFARGCLDRSGAQPIWRIAFSGVDDQNRPLESRFEIVLPPRTAAKAVQVSPAGRRTPTSDTPPEGTIIGAKTLGEGSLRLDRGPAGDARRDSCLRDQDRHARDLLSQGRYGHDA